MNKLLPINLRGGHQLDDTFKRQLKFCIFAENTRITNEISIEHKIGCARCSFAQYSKLLLNQNIPPPLISC